MKVWLTYVDNGCEGPDPETLQAFDTEEGAELHSTSNPYARLAVRELTVLHLEVTP